MMEEKNPDEAVRVNKFLAQAGLCSRREADRLIEQGKVLVDGHVAKAGEKVTAAQDIRVGKRTVKKEEEQILLAFYKPRGVVCTTDKRWNDLTVDQFLSYPKRIFSVGRLDKESEGLLLLTNDGRLQEAISRAANGHEKEYVVETDKPVTDAFLKKMAEGVYLKDLDVTTRPCMVKKLGKRKFSIVLTQGLNRQIRRMCKACGCQVVSLVRIRVMNILLGDLPAGEYRRVSKEEREELEERLNFSARPAGLSR